MIPPQSRHRLSRLALESIHHGVQHQRPLSVNLSDWPAELCEVRASFVTLHRHDELRGCIGGLTASLPLVRDVAEHAFAAAFKDPRFEPVGDDELGDLDIHLSVLSSPEPIEFDSEADLLKRLRPGQDGLILKEGARQGTFLPEVWEKLATPRHFLEQLKVKAGLSPDYWSHTLVVERYVTESW